MTRKDYILLAGALKSARVSNETDNPHRALYLNGIDNATANIADVLQGDNPEFNRALFVQAATGQVALTARKAV